MAHFPLLQNIYGIFLYFLVLMITAQRDIINTMWRVESKYLLHRLELLQNWFFLFFLNTLVQSVFDLCGLINSVGLQKPANVYGH